MLESLRDITLCLLQPIHGTTTLATKEPAGFARTSWKNARRVEGKKWEMGEIWETDVSEQKTDEDYLNKGQDAPSEISNKNDEGTIEWSSILLLICVYTWGLWGGGAWWRYRRQTTKRKLLGGTGKKFAKTKISETKEEAISLDDKKSFHGMKMRRSLFKRSFKFLKIWCSRALRMMLMV